MPSKKNAAATAVMDATFMILSPHCKVPKAFCMRGPSDNGVTYSHLELSAQICRGSTSFLNRLKM